MYNYNVYFEGVSKIPVPLKQGEANLADSLNWILDMYLFYYSDTKKVRINIIIALKCVFYPKGKLLMEESLQLP